MFKELRKLQKEDLKKILELELKVNGKPPYNNKVIIEKINEIIRRLNRLSER